MMKLQSNLVRLLLYISMTGKTDLRSKITINSGKVRESRSVSISGVEDWKTNDWNNVSHHFQESKDIFNDNKALLFYKTKLIQKLKFENKMHTEDKLKSASHCLCVHCKLTREVQTFDSWQISKDKVL